eukprot:3653267-Pleurochrysis_carterae.AAC.4
MDKHRKGASKAVATVNDSNRLLARRKRSARCAWYSCVFLVHSSRHAENSSPNASHRRRTSTTLGAKLPQCDVR